MALWSEDAVLQHGLGLQDEHSTSNIERPASNEKTNTQYRTFNHAKAWFLFSRFDTRNENLNEFFCFLKNIIEQFRLLDEWLTLNKF